METPFSSFGLLNEAPPQLKRTSDMMGRNSIVIGVGLKANEHISNVGQQTFVGGLQDGRSAIRIALG